MNLPPLPLEGCTELLSCATGLKLEIYAVTICASLLSLTWWQSIGLEWSNSTPKNGNNFGCKYSYLQGKSGISRVLTSEYKVMTGCLKLFAWSHNLVPWYQIRLYKLKKVLWTQNSVQNIGKIDNLQPKCLPFFGVELLHCRLTDFHQVTAKRVPNTVTYSNLSPVAHEISSGEAPKGGKFKDNSCIDISFLQLPSHIHSFVSSFP